MVCINSKIATNEDGQVDLEEMQQAVATLLGGMGEDTARSGLLDTPKRVVKMYHELTVGYRQSEEELVNGALFDVDHHEMVAIEDISFFSLCEHHLLPFVGTCTVAYIPQGKVIGLSKVARIVEMFARRLQVQERMTEQIADCMMRCLHAQGVAVWIKAEHFCMAMRGIKKPGSKTSTRAFRGIFNSDESKKEEFYRLVH